MAEPYRPNRHVTVQAEHRLNAQFLEQGLNRNALRLRTALPAIKNAGNRTPIYNSTRHCPAPTPANRDLSYPEAQPNSHLRMLSEGDTPLRLWHGSLTTLISRMSSGVFSNLFCRRESLTWVVPRQTCGKSSTVCSIFFVRAVLGGTCLTTCCPGIRYGATSGVGARTGRWRIFTKSCETYPVSRLVRRRSRQRV